MPNVKLLNMQDNSIEHVEPLSFAGLVKLDELNFIRNDLHTIPPFTAAIHSTLTCLRLQFNQVGVFDSNSISLCYLHSNM